MPITPDFSFISLLQYVFPAELLEVFYLKSTRIIRHAKTGEETLEITIEEKNIPPQIPDEHRGKPITSKGFHRPMTLQDFPLRDRFCLLLVHRRRWEIDGAGSLERQLSFIPKEGLKLTTTFAAFLKEADRTRTGGGRTHRETVRGETA
jgi:hypothetical protein